MARLEAGIIGYGKQSEILADVLNSVSGAHLHLAAVADVDEKRRALAKDKLGCLIFDSGEAMLDSLRPKLVIVATQPPEHCENVLAAIAHGAHVLCEKPIALTLKEADAMVEAANRAMVCLGVLHQTVFSSAFRRAEEMIRDGIIGRLYRIVAQCKGRPAPYDLMEIGVDWTHAMCHVAGFPEEVSGLEVTGLVVKGNRRAGVEDAAPISETYSQGRAMGIGMGDQVVGRYFFKHTDNPSTGGVVGELSAVSLAQHSSEFMTIEFFGTKGRLRLHQTGTGRLFLNSRPLDDFESTIGGWTEVDPRLWNTDPRWFVPTRRLVENFVEAIRFGRAPTVSGADGRMALEMVLGIYASHLAGRSLALPLEDRRHPLAKEE